MFAYVRDFAMWVHDCAYPTIPGNTLYLDVSRLKANRLLRVLLENRVQQNCIIWKVETSALIINFFYITQSFDHYVTW